MLYTLFSDIHGTRPDILRSRIGSATDAVVFAGDVDSVMPIIDMIDWENELLDMRKPFYRVPGNHGQALVAEKGFEIRSETLSERGETMRHLRKLIDRNLSAKKYLESMVKSGNTTEFYIDEKRFGKKYRTVLVHGGLDGDISDCPDCRGSEKQLWYRLKTEDDYMKNFSAMEGKGYDLMIRGHDHYPEIGTKHGDDIDISSPKMREVYLLEPDKEYTLTIGSLVKGFYALMETDYPNTGMPVIAWNRL